MSEKRPAKKIIYSYPKEIIKKFRDSSVEWKLNWLEEVNRLTFQVLSKKAKRFREKVRKGLV